MPSKRESSARVDYVPVSIHVGTRKMVNYAWIGWSQRKLWWRLAAVLTCKSIVKFGYRGERLIEPSSSWFLPKFPSGTRGTSVSDNWFLRLSDRAVPRSYHLLDYGWTPLSQNPCQNGAILSSTSYTDTNRPLAPDLSRAATRPSWKREAGAAVLQFNRALGWILCRRLSRPTGWCKQSSSLVVTSCWA